MAGPMEVLHINCKSSPTVAFESPFTQFYLYDLKEGSSGDDVVQTATAMELNAPKVKGLRPPPSWGEGVQSSRKWACVVGWDSVDVSLLERLNIYFEYNTNVIL